jgi:polysaccharide export outer membrane protein
MPPAHSDLVGYRPIPESLLPVAPVTPATGVPGQPANLPVPTNLGGPAMTMGPYTLGPDDVVHIAVAGQPDFTGTYVIGPDGRIQYGYLGDVAADGVTKEELAAALAERLKQYVRVPNVQVTIVGFNSKAIYILGMVARPGKYAMRGDSIKIRDALIAAGLVLNGAALSRVHIIKSDPQDPSYRVVNLKKVLYQGVLRDNVDLIDGDIVVVPSTFFSKITSFIGALLDPASKGRSVAYLAAL